MLVVRPIELSDIDDLLELADKAGPGMTSLPKDKSVLLKKIQCSIDSFDRSSAHADDYFLLVMEDTDKNKVVGTAGITAQTGAKEAYYAYRLMSVTHHSHSLQKQVRSEALHLSNDYTGCSTVGTFFLDPAYRGNGSWFGKSRYILMGLYPERFQTSVIAELRGYTDSEGKSPFWEAVGAHFFEMTFDEADHLSGIGSNQFITELIPKYPIYTLFLPDSAREVIGVPAEAGQRAKALLEKEGFRYERLVDLFDAGPIMRSEVKHLHTVQGLKKTKATVGQTNAASDAKKIIVSNGKWSDFRVSQITSGDNITCPTDVAAQLSIQADDEIAYFIQGASS